MTHLAAQLTEFACHTAWPDLATHVQQAARDIVATAIVDGVIGSTRPVVTHGAASCVVTADGDATLLGRQQRADPRGAAFVNTIAMQRDDATAASEFTGARSASAIVASTLAHAEIHDASIDGLLVAVTVGTEVALRLAAALAPLASRGWDPVGIVGRIGASVACTRLRRLDIDQTLNAIGIATTQSGGLATSAATADTAAYHAGKAAFDAIESAMLAERGFTGVGTVITGRNGLAQALQIEVDDMAALDDIGQRWMLCDLASQFAPNGLSLPRQTAMTAVLGDHADVCRTRLGALDTYSPAEVLDSARPSVRPIR